MTFVGYNVEKTSASALAGPGSGTDGLTNPVDGTRRVRAVLFDLDGTLYRQGPVRSLMALELLSLPVSGPFQAARRYRALAAYRHAQEHLRGVGYRKALASAQIAAAAGDSALSSEEVARLVGDWMEDRPLKYLRFSRTPGVLPLLDLLARANVRAGVLSDYPAASKLRALGLEGRFSPILCSTDPEIDAFKPNPRGFLRACQIWRLPPRDVLFVGDRIDVDAAGAAAAGMTCVIIGRPGRRSARRSHLVLRSLERLTHVLADRR